MRSWRQRRRAWLAPPGLVAALLALCLPLAHTHEHFGRGPCADGTPPTAAPAGREGRPATERTCLACAVGLAPRALTPATVAISPSGPRAPVFAPPPASPASAPDVAPSARGPPSIACA